MQAKSVRALSRAPSAIAASWAARVVAASCTRAKSVRDAPSGASIHATSWTASARSARVEGAAPPGDVGGDDTRDEAALGQVGRLDVEGAGIAQEVDERAEDDLVLLGSVGVDAQVRQRARERGAEPRDVLNLLADPRALAVVVERAGRELGELLGFGD